MAQNASPVYPAEEIEGLIAALAGVIAARVALGAAGRVEEIHVLADEQVPPKQMVRNIESALSAGLHVIIDRRIISVAQVRGDDALAFAADVAADAAAGTASQAAAAASPAEPPTAPDHDFEPAPVRYMFVGYDARTQPDLEAYCRVTIQRGHEVTSGSGTGPSTPLGRAQAAARAVFAAITMARQDHSMDLEGTTLVETHGRTYALVAAHAALGRNATPLTGIAALLRSPEEAAILASLQATNRWAELDG
jgi:hypothetical protein